MNTHQKYINRCIQLAKNGLGTTYPNPLVGSVIVLNHKIIGEGWHYKAGEPHAEVHAINSVKDQSLLKEATIYVSLEPCSHYGKTPPCSDLIIEKGIKKVVIGTIDPFAKVSGSGVKKLMNAGCDVIVGVLEKECNDLNKRFFTFHNKKRPYIILKWAQTCDHFIAPINTNTERKPIWITNPNSRQLVHKWRAEESAILVGNQTVIKDNPKLTIREWHGNHQTRIAIDLTNKIPLKSSILDQTTETIIITSEENKEEDKGNTQYKKVPKNTNVLTEICDILYNKEIQSIIIEGGRHTIQSFIDENLWDEARIFEGNTTFENGIKAPLLKGNLIAEEKIVNDTLRIYQND
ncbi:bifunctional diaminohydroxyphosphoribosylaminopyrimidine deaminase/5-amino-6-(5-phosphoribosylamino)uracil reductase RibD [Aquimarina sp. AD10]|uniref:bifunctional diaminohydroxyphosphoribosylaminopyrimidine deaminase/5-amino-6-(5-phosphoribosylamino)uracil reductase RibD n=1 Tax=Aquimarina sp. AD10 TaxID=1714849 RepID=UPI000E4CD9D6|nr:bifunctional diaminohydroxyphosphoribosylaminopyrimidine deaminase/5-amino-6-(5-phosphoribosylamino)uracil reductase RibD [Aquimarina sp. AD10]AXT63487.1 bifunctional diaminohydroxyphosphoribosylaminopyrimidine deaminase/5-amino-6-(5-phosphoribosylamino)uracil reductase RibD [Aquimarina sp. AD10]RKM99795.1 bifunctional diaminohydroxyphosphoribosylaminopyrimidine deaminase/5-amino-6-(5-phosphoribosylamino)uracil reductase RibD [Aquimarina sp. AD10]